MAGRKRAGKRRDVVCIGASAGGLDALTVVLSAFAADLPAAVLVVQHLDPRYQSHLAWILSKRVQLQVAEALEGVRVQPGTVLIAPPDRHMLVERDRIHLTATELVHFVRPSVDLLLESAATAFGDRVIAAILTGAGSDGALGISAVKNNGGLTIVQDPKDAESTGMPSAAVATGCIDMVLPLEKIGPEIVGSITQEKSHGVNGEP